MKKLIASIIAFSPTLAFAQPLNNINDVATKVTNIGDLLIKLAISFAILWTIISIVRYLVAGGEDDRKKGGMAILYGVIALVAIFSIWGLVFLVSNSLNLNKSFQPNINNMLVPVTGQVSSPGFAPTIRYNVETTDPVYPGMQYNNPVYPVNSANNPNNSGGYYPGSLYR